MNFDSANITNENVSTCMEKNQSASEYNKYNSCERNASKNNNSADGNTIEVKNKIRVDKTKHVQPINQA